MKLFNEGGQMARFCITGALSVFTYYAILIGATELFHVWYIASAFLAFLSYFVTNFTLQKIWAFRDKSIQYIKRQLIQFSIMAVCNWTINTTLLYVLVEYAGMWYVSAQMILTIVVSIIAYFCLRYIFSTQLVLRQT